MGRPLTFHYGVKLGPRTEGYPIREQRCAPAAGDTGHTYMCQYLENREGLMKPIDREKPLLGQRLKWFMMKRRNTWCKAWRRCSTPEPTSSAHAAAARRNI